MPTIRGISFLSKRVSITSSQGVNRSGDDSAMGWDEEELVSRVWPSKSASRASQPQSGTRRDDVTFTYRSQEFGSDYAICFIS
jgi:hypothetical protein